MALGLLSSAVVLGAVIGGIVLGFRAMSTSGHDGNAGPQADGAESAKSAAIHIGLFLAMLACATGVIDLLQALVESDRIVGPNPDIARGLALLIVGGPVLVALLGVIDRRYAARAVLGDARPHLGWSVYLVAALTTTLVATLTSVVQVTESLTSEFGEYRPEELMALLGWLAFWLLHWFGLRPRFGVRGDVHLAAGSIIGLGWTIGGIGAVVYRILDEAYQSAFNDSLTGSYGISFWIVFALVGAAVWAWHWHVHLNAAGSVEGDRRRSPLWFLTVVVAGVLPGLVAMLVSATMMVSGVLVWFIGSTDKDAADFFEPAAILTTVVFVGFVSWAYHRWELDRGGAPERNDSLRFHDYVVLAAGVIGVVGATAVVVGQLLEAIAAKAPLAGSLDIANTLIVAVTVLVAWATVWWQQWSLVERHRAVDPAAESDSIWRKLYLLAAFGIGGVVLGIAAIWVLFIGLRDVLDSGASRETLQNLVNPAGWGVAVVGAVWYHLGVWRVDRAVLGAQAAPDESLTIVRSATAADHGEIFTLQRAAAAHDALRSGALDTATLPKTFAEASTQLAAATIRVAVDGTRVVGALVQRRADDETPGYEVLVAPDQDHNSVSALLLTG